VHEQVVYDSDTEKTFADHSRRTARSRSTRSCQVGSRCLRHLAAYNPDWAVLVQTEEGERLYFRCRNEEQLVRRRPARQGTRKDRVQQRRTSRHCAPVRPPADTSRRAMSTNCWWRPLKARISAPTLRTRKTSTSDHPHARALKVRSGFGYKNLSRENLTRVALSRRWPPRSWGICASDGAHPARRDPNVFNKIEPWNRVRPAHRPLRANTHRTAKSTRLTSSSTTCL